MECSCRVAEAAFVISVMASKRKKSAIWNFYSVGKDSEFALCKTCGQKVSRGGTTIKTFNTSNLISHLKIKHQEEHADFVIQKGEAEWESQQMTSAKSAAKQLTLQESEDRTRVWDTNDA